MSIVTRDRPYMPFTYYENLRQIGKYILKLMLSRSKIIFNDYDKIYEYYEPNPNDKLIFKVGMNVWTNDRLDFNDGTFLPINSKVRIRTIQIGEIKLYAYGYYTLGCNHVTFTAHPNDIRGYELLHSSNITTMR